MSALSKLWGKWWVRKENYDEAKRLLHEARLDFIRCTGQVQDETRRHAETAAALAAHLEASELVMAHVWEYPDLSLGARGGRLLRLDITIDDRVIHWADHAPHVIDAIVREAQYKTERGIRSLDFALAASVMKEK